jgi:hypothetical protein
MSIQATSEMIAAFNEAFRAVRNDSVTYEDALKLGIEAALSAVPQPVDEPVAWIIDWPDEPELGHYFSEAPDAIGGRSRPLYMQPLKMTELQQDYIDLHNKHEALKAEFAETEEQKRAFYSMGSGLTKEHAALKAEVERLKQFEVAYNEWMDKSEWITPLIKPRHLGKHRLDVMRELYEEAKQEQRP